MNITPTIKLKIKLLSIFLKDLFTLTIFKFPTREMHQNFNYSMEISQEIKPSKTFENKVYNLELASNRINQYVIKPGEVFSFWKAVENPNVLFKKSRSIIKGKLVEEPGGGLCQVSGIIYHLAILAGLTITERYNHSMDIYTEETRFTPLGTDAAVVYGSKDLRILNIHNRPIAFSLKISGNRLSAALLSDSPLSKHTLLFNEMTYKDDKIIEVYDEQGCLINISKYRRTI